MVKVIVRSSPTKKQPYTPSGCPKGQPPPPTRREAFSQKPLPLLLTVGHSLRLGLRRATSLLEGGKASLLLRMKFGASGRAAAPTRHNDTAYRPSSKRQKPPLSRRFLGYCDISRQSTWQAVGLHVRAAFSPHIWPGLPGPFGRIPGRWAYPPAGGRSGAYGRRRCRGRR